MYLGRAGGGLARCEKALRDASSQLSTQGGSLARRDRAGEIISHTDLSREIYFSVPLQILASRS